MKINITVCELPDERSAFLRAWEGLVEHVHDKASQIVILPEMPFSAWFAADPQFHASTWQDAVEAHESWMSRLQELAPASVLSSRPVYHGQKRLNEGFLWENEREYGYRPVHQKYYLPNEAGCWEASWYQQGDGMFVPLEYQNISLGMLICTELWSPTHAQQYGQAGVHLLVVPRATERATVEKWIVGGQAAAIIAGAFCVSSNRVSTQEKGGAFGGGGWIIGPDGDILGLTSQDEPFITIEIDRHAAIRAKDTYPCSVFIRDRDASR